MLIFTPLFIAFFLWLGCICQLGEARDRTLQRVSRAAEYKELKGNDPSRDDLLKKVEQVRETFG